jgi:hypothetical protein
MAATTMAASLLNPASASLGSRMCVTESASTMSSATTSLRSRSVTSSVKATTRMTRTPICGPLSPPSASPIPPPAR